jgi:single-strand DNA-binding protein
VSVTDGIFARLAAVATMSPYAGAPNGTRTPAALVGVARVLGDGGGSRGGYRMTAKAVAAMEGARMSNLNKVMLMGRLTRDVEVRATPSGQEVAVFSLAINRTYYVGDPGSREKREETTFIDCELWGRRTQALATYTSKGSPLFVEGRLKQDQWEDRQTGQKRSKVLVVVENFEFIGGGRGGGHETSVEAGAGRSTSPDAVPLDDIPF